jgi:hypothetical protein
MDDNLKIKWKTTSNKKWKTTSNKEWKTMSKKIMENNQIFKKLN